MQKVSAQIPGLRVLVDLNLDRLLFCGALGAALWGVSALSLAVG